MAARLPFDLCGSVPWGDRKPLERETGREKREGGYKWSETRVDELLRRLRENNGGGRKNLQEKKENPVYMGE